MPLKTQPSPKELIELVEKLQEKEKKIKTDRDLLYLILQSIDYGITVQDAKGTLIYANQAGAKISGYSSPLTFMNTPRSQILQKFTIMDEKGLPFDISKLPGRLTLKDKKAHKAVLCYRTIATKKDRYTAVKSIPIFNKKGTIEYVVNAFQDITDRKLEEKRIEHFIGIGSHELKTPLAGIKALNQILEKQFKEKKYQNAIPFFNKIDRKVNELTKIINDFLVVEKIRVGKLEFIPEMFDFDTLIAEAIHDLQSIIPAHTIVVVGKANKEIVADKNRVVEVINNLIRNARKYSPEGTTITVQVSSDTKQIEVAIKDEGIGISEDNMLLIFEPFFRVQSRVEGLGLGLYISSKIVELHGGKMWIKSEVGKGSTFYFTLPLRPVQMKKNFSF